MDSSQSKLSTKSCLIGIFILSFGIIFLETIFFHLLKYVASYLEASSIISIALLGISLGGFAAFYLRRWAGVVLPLAALLFPVTIMASFYGITYFSTEIGGYSWVLIPPFFFSSLVVSITFIFLPANRVYFVNLLGGAVGVLLIAFVLRHLGEVNTVFFITAFVFCGCFPLFGSLQSGLLRKVARGVVVLLILGLVVLIFVNNTRRKANSPYINLPYIVRVWDQSEGRKVFAHLKRKQRAKILASASSLVGRVDILRYYKDGRYKRTKNYDHGQRIDTLRNRPQEVYDNDPRLPKGFLKDPDVLIIGAGGEAITKTSKNLGNGTVTASEINPAMVEVMSGPMAEFTQNCYSGIDMHIMDGRTFVERARRKYDIITLLNTYAGYGMTAGKEAFPEYLHTTEAMKKYLNLLTDRGFIMFEETIPSGRYRGPDSIPGRRGHGDLVIHKLVNTVFKAFEELGVENPKDHFFVYQWKHYIQIIVKKRPLTREEDQFLLDWMVRTSDPNSSGFFIRQKYLLFSPFRTPSEYLGAFIAAEGKGSLGPEVDLSPNTDDHPFPFDTYPERLSLKSTFWRIVGLACLLALLPPLVIFLAKYRLRAVESIPYFSYFGFLGIGYFLVQVVLMQKSQVYLGSPTYSFAGVLGIMLFASGVGGWFSSRIKGKRFLLVFVAIPIILLLLRGGLDSVFSATASFPLAGRIALTFLLMAPVSFFMGMPFPFGLESSKRRFSGEYAALMLAVNGGFSAIGVPLSLLCSTSYGFSFTFLVGLLAYVLVAGMFLIGRLAK